MEVILNIVSTIVGFLGVFGITFVIEKSTIKINPLSILKKFLVGDLSEKIDNIEKTSLMARSQTIRYELANFEKLAENGLDLTENDMALVRDLYEEYHDILKQNHYGTIIYNNIEELYAKQQEEKKQKAEKKKAPVRKRKTNKTA